VSSVRRCNKRSEVESQLAELGDPKSKYSQAEGVYKANKDAADQLDSERAALDDLKRSRKEIKDELQKFDGLTEEIETLEKRLDELSGARDEYIQKKDLAGKIEERKTSTIRLTRRLSRYRRILKRLKRNCLRNKHNMTPTSMRRYQTGLARSVKDWKYEREIGWIQR